MTAAGRYRTGWYAVQLCRVLAVALPVLFVLLSIFLWSWPYSCFLEVLLKYYQLQAKAETFRTQWLSPVTYQYLRYGCSAGTLLLLLVSLKFFGRTEEFVHKVSDWLRPMGFALQRQWLEAHPAERWAVGGSMLLVSIWRIGFAYLFPVHIDEAFGYVFLIDRGVLATLAYYPGPNNHVGYNIFPAVLSALGFSPLWSLRLPVVFIATVFSFLFLLWIWRYWGIRIALGAHCLFAFSWHGLFYSTHGRAYFLQLLCYLLSFVFLADYHKKGHRFSAAAFVLVSAWGLWAVPTYLYLLIVQIVLYFWLAKGRRIGLLQMSASIVVLSALLYSPLILFNGSDALLQNAWVKPLSSADYTRAWLHYLPQAYGYNYPSDGAWPLSLLLWFFLGFRLYRERIGTFRYLLILILAASLLPAVFIYLQKVLPFVRIWLFRSALEYIGWAYLLYRLLAGRAYYYCLILYLAAMLFYTQRQWQHNFNDYRALTAMNEYIALHYAPPVLLFTNYDLANVMLRYHFKKQVLVDCPVPEPSVLYDLLIFERSQPLPDSLPSPTMPLVYSDDYVRIFGSTNTGENAVLFSD